MENYEKAYKEALKVIESLYNIVKYQSSSDALLTSQTIEKAFPELKESEDERIRKRLIEIAKIWKDGGYAFGYSDEIDDILSWLEKQGEKIEPIEGFNTEFERQISHLIASTINKEHEYTKDFVKWTSDALLNYAKHEIEKQGNKKPIDELTPQEAMDIAVAKCFEQGEQKSTWSEEDEMHIRELERLVKQVWAIAEHENNKDTIHKMSDLSFFLKTLKPQLKQDEQKSAVDTKVIIPKFRVGDIVKSKSQPMLSPRKIISIGKDCYWCEDRGCIGFAWEDDCELVEHNPSWSEEDEKILKRIDNLLYSQCTIHGSEYEKLHNWLKSIKPHWKPSEQELAALRTAISVLKEERNFPLAAGHLQDILNHFESKEIRNDWKPSEEQMEALFEAKLASTKNREYFLGLLYEDLKKL